LAYSDALGGEEDQKEKALREKMQAAQQKIEQ
jgi:hypothetical protein